MDEKLINWNGTRICPKDIMINWLNQEGNIYLTTLQFNNEGYEVKFVFNIYLQLLLYMFHDKVNY